MFNNRRDGETDLEERLAAHGVSVDSRRLPPGGPDPFLVIERDGAFAGALGVGAAERLLEPPIVRPGEREGVSEGYRVFFELLEETVFSAMERRQLLAVSREIEDRAYRVGSGKLSVSFQTFSTFESQLGVYRHLAAETDLDIRIHGLADWTPPEIAGITYHGYTDDILGRYWILAFTDDTDGTQSCGLLARERSDSYEGFWTDDPNTVDDIRTALTEREPVYSRSS